MANSNTVSILFNSNDKIKNTENRYTFIFGKTASTITPCTPKQIIDDNTLINYYQPINSENLLSIVTCPTILCLPCKKQSNDFEVACSAILKNDTNDFDVICDTVSQQGKSVYFDTISTNFGINISIEFALDLPKTINGFGVNVNLDPQYLIIPDSKFGIGNGYIGYTQDVQIIAYKNFEAERFSFGYNLDQTIILFNPYTIFLNKESYGYFGISQQTNLLTNPYTIIDREFNGSFGIISRTYVYFNAYNPMFPFNGSFGYTYQSNIYYAENKDSFELNTSLFFGFDAKSNLKYDNGEEQNNEFPLFNSTFGISSNTVYKYLNNSKNDIRETISRFGTASTFVPSFTQNPKSNIPSQISHIGFNLEAILTIENEDNSLFDVSNGYFGFTQLSVLDKVEIVDLPTTTNFVGYNSSWSIDFVNVFENPSIPSFGFSSTHEIINQDDEKDDRFRVAFSYIGNTLAQDLTLDRRKVNFFDNINTYGVKSNTILQYDSKNTFFIESQAKFGFANTSIIRYNSYNPLILNNNVFGVESETPICFNPSDNYIDNIVGSFGCNANTLISYNDRNVIEVQDGDGAKFGIKCNTLISYNDTNPLGEFYGHVGYDNNIIFISNKRNSLIELKDELTTEFGFNGQFQPITNKRNVLISKNNPAIAYGLSITSNVFLINNSTTNYIENINTNRIGFVSTSTMRYSDDQQLSPSGVDSYYGVDSKVDVKFGNERLSIVANPTFGITSGSTIRLSVGFINNQSFGIQSRSYSFKVKVQTAIFYDINAHFGYTLMNNHLTPRYFDLSKENCCYDATHRNELLEFELTDTPDYDVLFGLHNHWDAFGSSSMLTTQPRFKFDVSVGVNSCVVDHRYVEFGEVRTSIGVNSFTRSMVYDVALDLSYTNYTPSQHRVYFELDQEDPKSFNEYDFYLGLSSIGYLSVQKEINAMFIFPTNEIQVELLTEEAIKISVGFSCFSSSSLATRVSLDSKNNSFGVKSLFGFEEKPSYSSFGITSTFEFVQRQYEVELMEKGELVNNYVFTNKNGDPDKTRPTEISIEGYPYIHKIKGRCY